MRLQGARSGSCPQLVEPLLQVLIVLCYEIWVQSGCLLPSHVVLHHVHPAAPRHPCSTPSRGHQAPATKRSFEAFIWG